MALRCRDIPQLPGLEAIRLRGGESGADNEVRWPYLAENRSFKSWVRGSELVFITGISRHRSPENLAECLHEGKTCGIAGLVVLTGDTYIGQLPAMLGRLADELVIPLFEQPYSLPMVEVTETISRAIVCAEQAARQPPADTLAKALAAELQKRTGTHGRGRPPWRRCSRRHPPLRVHPGLWGGIGSLADGVSLQE